MAGVVLGTGSGVLAAAAVYYTLSTSLRDSTASLRGELAQSNALLQSSFSGVPPPAASALVGPASRGEPRFSDLVRQRWNVAVASAFTSVRSADYAALGAAAWDTGRELVHALSPSAAQVHDAAVEMQHDVHVGAEAVKDGVERGYARGAEAVKGGYARVKHGYEAGVAGVEEGLHRVEEGLHAVGDKVKHGLDEVRDAADALERRLEAGKDAEAPDSMGTTVVPGAVVSVSKPAEADTGLRGAETFTGGSAVVVKTQRELERDRGRLV